jgi:hypothetical protein
MVYVSYEFHNSSGKIINGKVNPRVEIAAKINYFLVDHIMKNPIGNDLLSGFSLEVSKIFGE